MPVFGNADGMMESTFASASGTDLRLTIHDTNDHGCSRVMELEVYAKTATGVRSGQGASGPVQFPDIVPGLRVRLVGACGSSPRRLPRKFTNVAWGILLTESRQLTRHSSLHAFPAGPDPPDVSQARRTRMSH